MLQRYNLSNQEVPLLIGRVVKYSFRSMSSQGALGVFCSYVVRRYELSTTRARVKQDFVYDTSILSETYTFTGMLY